jgi:pimeloyl-ACP methyl ester carboxylesterase
MLGLVGALICTLLHSHGAAAAEATLVSLTTPRGAKQGFIMIKPDKPPVASVILFAGGHGALGLKSATSMGWGTGNFLVRTRGMFAAAGLQVAIVDAPSDQQDGMNGKFRMSRDHAADIGAVVAHLKKTANVPVWLVGTSMGTFSAANGAANASGVHGLVLTSSITRARAKWNIAGTHPDGVASMPLQRFSGPALILSHAKDGCEITPAADSPKLKSRLSGARKADIVILDGGSPPQSEPCEAKSQHGFLGIEGRAVDAIATFVKANGG